MRDIDVPGKILKNTLYNSLCWAKYLMTQRFCKYQRLEEKEMIRSFNTWIPGYLDAGHVIWLLDQCEGGQEAETDTLTSALATTWSVSTTKILETPMST